MIPGKRYWDKNYLQSAMMAEAMHQAGKEAFAHRLQFYREWKSFLAQNL